jgi:competence protein ComEA
MTLQTFVRALTLPVLGLAMSGVLASAPAAAETPAAPAAEKARTVNINQASVKELANLPRVGEKLAERIVAHRTDNGPFKRVEDLMAVKGVGDKMFERLRPYLATNGATLTEGLLGSQDPQEPSSRRAPHRPLRSAGKWRLPRSAFLAGGASPSPTSYLRSAPAPFSSRRTERTQHGIAPSARLPRDLAFRASRRCRAHGRLGSRRDPGHPHSRGSSRFRPRPARSLRFS